MRRAVQAAALVPALVATAPAGADEWFEDRTAASGIDFVHDNGMTGELYYHEMMGGGVGLLDYDGDGDLDLYLVQGGPIGATGKPRPCDRLLRNDAAGAAGAPRFVDAGHRLGVCPDGYGMGLAVGDVDNDGWPDLYLLNFGPNQLLRNRGDGSFEDVTAASGAGELRWTAGAAFADYDGDGWQDLYLANYVRFDPADNLACTDPAGRRDYCGPLAFPPEPDRLLRNCGDGGFEDVTRRAGIAEGQGAALGVVAGDFDADGRPDFYVANDMTANLLWINQGDGSFRDEALLAGAAVNADGQPEASMGVAVGDYDRDGDEDLFVTHLDNQTNTLYRNGGAAQFADVTEQSGLAAPSWRSTGFGTAWLDADNDGWLDLATVNGAVKTLEEQSRAGDPLPLKQPNLLFVNRAGAGFEERAAELVPAFGALEVSRGLAVGDVDNDGDPDLLVGNNAGPARLLVNRVGQERGWLGLRLLGEPPLAELPGSRAAVAAGAGPPVVRTVRTGGSYASASDPRLLAGLGDAGPAVRLDVTWPGGRRVRWLAAPAGRYLSLRRPAGSAP